MVVIGIGTAGNNVVKSFSKGHKKILIGPGMFPKTCKTVEDYEKKCLRFLKKNAGCLFVEHQKHQVRL